MSDDTNSALFLFLMLGIALGFALGYFL